MRGGCTSYPGKASDLAPRAANGVIKPGRRGDPKAAREKRVADSQAVLRTRGLRSTGNGVEEKPPAIGKWEELMKKQEPENPPLMMVNTHPRFIIVPKAGPDIGAIVVPVWEVADERRLQHHLKTDLVLRGKEVRKPNGGVRNARRGCPISRCLSGFGACPTSGNPLSAR